MKGHVTLDGKPLKIGTVITIPDAGRGHRGFIQPDGSFELGTLQYQTAVRLHRHPPVGVAYERTNLAPGQNNGPGKLISAASVI